jgi:hypothetical protein
VRHSLITTFKRDTIARPKIDIASVLRAYAIDKQQNTAENQQPVQASRQDGNSTPGPFSPGKVSSAPKDGGACDTAVASFSTEPLVPGVGKRPRLRQAW